MQRFIKHRENIKLQILYIFISSDAVREVNTIELKKVFNIILRRK